MKLGWKIIMKRINVNFISWWLVSAVISRFVKQVFKKQWLNPSAAWVILAMVI